MVGWTGGSTMVNQRDGGVCFGGRHDGVCHLWDRNGMSRCLAWGRFGGLRGEWVECLVIC